MAEFRKKKLTESVCQTTKQMRLECDEEPDKPEVKHRNRFTIEQKLHILNEMKVLTVHEVCEKYDINDRTLRSWKLNQARYTEASSKKYVLNSKKLNENDLRDELDDRLYIWTLDALTKGNPVSGKILSQQALVLNNEIGAYKDFHASDGWISKWKKRKNVRSLKITGIIKEL